MLQTNPSMTVVAFVLIVGVPVLVGVLANNPERREDARAMVRELLRVFRPPRPPAA